MKIERLFQNRNQDPCTSLHSNETIPIPERYFFLELIMNTMDSDANHLQIRKVGIHSFL